MSLCDVMHNPEHISEGLKVGKYMVRRKRYIHSCSIVGGPVVVVNIFNYFEWQFYSPQWLTLPSVRYTCTEMCIPLCMFCLMIM